MESSSTDDVVTMVDILEEQKGKIHKLIVSKMKDLKMFS